MNIEGKDLELIARYFQGDCDQEEMATIESRRKTDIDFARLINQQKLITDGFSGMQMIDLEEILENHRTRKKILWFRIVSWAAILLLAFGGGWWWSHEINDPSNIAKIFYKLPIAEIERNNMNTSGDDPYVTGLNQFASGDFAASITSFSKITLDEEQYWFAQYYKAHAEYQTSLFSAARSDFDRIVNSNISTLTEASEWNALLSALRNSEPIKERLNLILEDPKHFYYQQAKDIEEKYD